MTEMLLFNKKCCAKSEAPFSVITRSGLKAMISNIDIFNYIHNSSGYYLYIFSLCTPLPTEVFEQNPLLLLSLSLSVQNSFTDSNII